MEGKLEKSVCIHQLFFQSEEQSRNPIWESPSSVHWPWRSFMMGTEACCHTDGPQCDLQPPPGSWSRVIMDHLLYPSAPTFHSLSQSFILSSKEGGADFNWATTCILFIFQLRPLLPGRPPWPQLHPHRLHSTAPWTLLQPIMIFHWSFLFVPLRLWAVQALFVFVDKTLPYSTCSINTWMNDCIRYCASSWKYKDS